MTRRKVGIRNETIDILERRAPLIPEHVAVLTREHGLSVIVQPSKTRVFPDGEYERAGATISADLGECNIVFGVKEVPIEDLQTGPAYCFFSLPCSS